MPEIENRPEWDAYLTRCHNGALLGDVVLHEYEQKLHQKIAPLSQILTVAHELGLDLDAEATTIIRDQCLYIKLPIPLPKPPPPPEV